MNLFGFSKKDITPEIGCLLYGYVDDLKSESIHDRLNINAFYFGSDTDEAFMITAEVCSINTAFSEKMRKEIATSTSVPYENIILHAIHNHTGPNTDGNTGWGPLDTDYCENILLPAAISAANEAKMNATKAYVGINIGKSDVAVNRREQDDENHLIFGQCEWGCYDPRMAVFSFKDESGKILASMIYYTCHGTCAGKNTAISRDWAGGMIDALEEHTGAPAAFFCGPEGDIGPRLRNGQTVGDMDDVEYMGALAGNDAVKVFDGINEYKPLEFKLVASEISIPLKPRISFEDAMEKFMEFRHFSVNLEGQIRDYSERVLRSYEEGYTEEKTRTTPQTLISICNNIFISFPFELFSEIALRINKAKSGYEVFSLSNTNGSEGYFPTHSEISKGGYEIDMFLTANIQPYADNADWHLIKETLKNLEEY